MRKILIKGAILSFLLFSFVEVSGQAFEYKWQRVKMDKRYETSKIHPVDKIISDAQGAMGALMDILIYSSEELDKGQPESALSNIAADALLHGAEPFIDPECKALSLINFGGIRMSFPQGAIRLYDVYSTFPFDNTLVVAKMKGKELRKILSKFAGREKFEALGGVEVVVTDKKLSSVKIGGEMLDDEALYDLVTIDFLLDGGDRFNIGENAISVTRTGIVMRDVVEGYLKDLASRGVVLKNAGDGRVVIQ